MFNPFRILAQYAIMMIPVSIDRGAPGASIFLGRLVLSFEHEAQRQVVHAGMTEIFPERHVFRVGYGGSVLGQADIQDQSVNVEVKRYGKGNYYPHQFTFGHAWGERPNGFAYWSKPRFSRTIGPFFVGFSSGADEDDGLRRFSAKREAEKATEAATHPS